MHEELLFPSVQREPISRQYSIKNVAGAPHPLRQRLDILPRLSNNLFGCVVCIL